MIREADKSIETFLLDDPVRPHIPLDVRFNKNNKVFYYYDSEADAQPKAIVCAAFRNYIPTNEDDIIQESAVETNSVLTLYTIWSYAAGAGRSLVFELLDYVKDSLGEIERIVTLSPKTDMARRFHMKNGAVELQENDTTINYEYPINKR
jgi:hypothetical protein